MAQVRMEKRKTAVHMRGMCFGRCSLATVLMPLLISGRKQLGIAHACFLQADPWMQPLRGKKQITRQRGLKLGNPHHLVH